MTRSRSRLRIAITLTFLPLALACGEDGVSIGSGQCHNIPRYEIEDLAVEATSNGYRTIVNPNVTDPAERERIERVIEQLEDAENCITPLGGAATEVEMASGSGGSAGAPSEPDSGALDGGTTDAAD